MILNILKRISQIALIFIIVLIMIGITVGGMLGVSIIKIMEDAPKINPKTILLDLNENSKIVDKDGKLIESIAYEEYREIVKYKDIPQKLIDAFVSIEDERFMSHNGIDFKGIIKSTIDNFKAGDIVRGGSTITQQLVKNIYLSEEVKWERKATELILALEVDSKLTKEEILESYLNRVYLGQHSYGVKTGAMTYFSKPLNELTLAQCATIAGIVNSPSSYSLFYSYYPSAVPKDAKVLGEYSVGGENFVAVLNKNAFTRKNLVLAKMLELNKITKKEYDAAIKEDVAASVIPNSKKPVKYSNRISNLIKSQAIERIMETQKLEEKDAYRLLYTGGLTIKTTIDWELQKKLEKAYENLEDIISEYEDDNGPFLAKVKRDDDGDILDSAGNKLFYHRENLLTKNKEYYIPSDYFKLEKNGDLTISASRFTVDGNYIYVKNFYDINDKNNIVTYRSGSINLPTDYTIKHDNGSFTIKSEFLKKNEDFYSIKDDILIINKKYYSIETEGTVQPQSSTVVIDNSTGEIKAAIGARGKSSDDNIDRLNNFPRQPGSTMKPLAVYAPAIDTGYTPASPIDDTPFSILDGRAWPGNAYGSYNGIMTLRSALANSTNTTAVKLLNSIGIETSKRYLERFGLINNKNPKDDNYISKEEDASNNDENLAFSLGAATKGFSVLDLAQAYTAFPNGGTRKEATIISEIKSNKIGLIYKNENKSIPVISPQSAFLMTDILKDVVNYTYDGIANNDLGIETAGKTGSTENSADLWFVGFNPYYTSATWFGFDNANIKMDAYSSMVAKFYGSYTNDMLEGKEAKKFNKPDGIVQRTVSKVDGLLASELTQKDPRGNMAYTEYFDEKVVPTTISTAHINVKIDKRNGLLATSATPPFLTEEKVFINRPIKYNPEQFNNIVPSDWDLNPPTKESDLKFEPVQKTEVRDDGTVVVTKQVFTGETIITYTRVDGSVRIVTKAVDGTETVQEIPSPSSNPLGPNPQNPQSNNQTNSNQNNTPAGATDR